jgi:type 1 glutamine amidotransferase
MTMPRILVFSKIGAWRDLAHTLPGYYHQSIPAGQAMLRRLGEEEGFTLSFTDSSAAFTEEGLAPFDATIFLNPNGYVFNAPERAVFQNFIRAGKGYVGIHAAANCELDWPWYRELIGACETGVHANKADGKITLLEPSHRSTQALPKTFSVQDEWLSYDRDVRSMEGEPFNVLAVVDESAYREGATTQHAISWCREFEGGRTWYTGFGHHAEAFANPHVVEHIRGGIRYALGGGR